MNITEQARAVEAGRVSVVVPVYRSREMLVELHHRLVAVFVSLGRDYEIVLVEDGGNDGSWEVIRELTALDGRVRGRRLSRNFSQHNALLCGIRAATGDVIVTIDDDLQNPPEEIPKLLAVIATGSDVVYGTPARPRHGFLRNLASRTTKYVLQAAMGAETAAKVSAFRAFRTCLREGFADYRGPSANIDVLLSWVSSSFAAVTVEHQPRAVGASNYTLIKLLAHAANMTTGFSTKPLRLASFVGFLFTAVGVGVLAFVIYRYLVDGIVVPGFYFLASIIAIFSGAQLFSLGVIGEYLARMHFRMMDRPCYVVEETAEGQADRR